MQYAWISGPKLYLLSHRERKMNLSLIQRQKKKMALWRRKPVGLDFNQDKILLLVGKTIRLPSKAGIIYQAWRTQQFLLSPF